MLRTSVFTCDDQGDPEPVTITTPCTEVSIAPQDGVTTYRFRAPNKDSDGVLKYNGQETRIRVRSFFYPSQVVGYIETLSGSAVFQMEQS